MSTFSLALHGTAQRDRIAGVVSFVAEDASGQFGVLARHARLLTVLTYGVARYRLEAGDWSYLALPGGVCYFAGDTLNVATRRYVQGPDYDTVRRALSQQLLQEEEQLHSFKESLDRLEREMMRKLWHMEQ